MTDQLGESVTGNGERARVAEWLRSRAKALVRNIRPFNMREAEDLHMIAEVVEHIADLIESGKYATLVEDDEASL